MITFWQQTDMSWPHPIFWFPWVIQFYIEWYMGTCLLVFLFPLFFAGKHGFCTEINHAVHKKAQLLTHLYNKTKTRRVKKDVQAFPLSMSLRKCMRGGGRWVFGCSVWLCSHKRTKEEPLLKQQVGSIALRMLFCTVWVCSVLKIACETQEDGDFVACIAEKWQTHVVHEQNNKEIQARLVLLRIHKIADRIWWQLI